MEFNKAKDILNQELAITKEKYFRSFRNTKCVYYYTYRLEEIKIKYRNREPRPEDLEQIRQWKNIASEQEVRIKEIMVSKLYLKEKQFYKESLNAG